jgi:hypothetical protein
VNIPISPKGYARNRKRAVDFLNIRPRVIITILITSISALHY